MKLHEAMAKLAAGEKVRHKQWEACRYVEIKNGYLSNGVWGNSENSAFYKFYKRHFNFELDEWEIYDDRVTIGSLKPGEVFIVDGCEYTRLDSDGIAQVNAFYNYNYSSRAFPYELLVKKRKVV